MAYKALTHVLVLEQGCLLCCISKGDKTLSDKLKQLLRENVSNEAADNLDKLPKRVCKGCARKLLSSASPKPRPMHPVDYSALLKDLVGRDPKASAKECGCDLCFHATWKPVNPKTDKRPQSKYLLKNPVANEAPRGRGKERNVAPPHVCGACLCEVAKGKTHPCSKETMMKNLSVRMSPRAKSQFASQVVKEQLESSSPSPSGVVELQNLRGKPSQLSTAPVRTPSQTRRSLLSKSTPLPHGAFADLEVQEGLSTRGTQRTARLFRSKGIVVEPNLEKALVLRRKALGEFFIVEAGQFITNDSPQPERKPVVLCTDPLSFVQKVLAERQVETSVRLHLGLDGGGQFLKLCLNIIPGEASPSQSPLAKRQAKFGGEKYSATGVKKLFILGLVPSVPENYHNIKELVGLAKITGLSGTLGTDLKLANIFCGLTNHSSKHPCCWCEVDNSYQTTAPPKLRTLGTIREKARAYKTTKQTKRNARPQDFANCVEEPLFTNVPEEVEVLDLIPPPELHLMTGIVVKVYDQLCSRLESNPSLKAKIDLWAKSKKHPEGRLQGRPNGRKQMQTASQVCC